MSTGRKFLLFFMISSLLGCSFYFAWAWSSVSRENAVVRSQLSSLTAQSKNTEEAVARLRRREEEASGAREIQSKNEQNLRESTMKALEQVKKLEEDNHSFKSRVEALQKSAAEAEKRVLKAEKELKGKEVIVESQWRRIERLETQTRSLDQEKHDFQVEAKRQKELREREEKGKQPDENEVEKTKETSKKNDELLRKKDREIEKLKSELKRSQKAEKKEKPASTKKPEAGKSFPEANRRIVELTQDAAVAHYNLGVMYMRSGQYENAQAEFQYALAINPADALAHYNLAVIQDAYLGNPKGAISHYETYMRLLPKAEDLKKVQYRIFQMRLQQEKGVGKDLSGEFR